MADAEQWQIRAILNDEGLWVRSNPMIRIVREDGSILVEVSLKDGSVTFGEGYVPDEAARIFWDAIARNFPVRNAADATDEPVS